MTTAIGVSTHIQQVRARSSDTAGSSACIQRVVAKDPQGYHLFCRPSSQRVLMALGWRSSYPGATAPVVYICTRRGGLDSLMNLGNVRDDGGLTRSLQSLLADYTPSERRGRAFGFMSFVGAIGGMLGGLFATNVGSTGPDGWRFAFHLMALVSIVTGILVWRCELETTMTCTAVRSKRAELLHSGPCEGLRQRRANRTAAIARSCWTRRTAGIRVVKRRPAGGQSTRQKAQRSCLDVRRRAQAAATARPRFSPNLCELLPAAACRLPLRRCGRRLAPYSSSPHSASSCCRRALGLQNCLDASLERDLRQALKLG